MGNQLTIMQKREVGQRLLNLFLSYILMHEYYGILQLLVMSWLYHCLYNTM